MTPEEALTIIENVKTQAPEQMVATANTIAVEAARWAKDSQDRDRKLYRMFKNLEKAIFSAAGVPEAATAESPTETATTEAAATPSPAGFEGVDPTTLKGADLERYMDAMTGGMPENPNAPAPKGPPPISADAAERIVAEQQTTRPSKNGSARV